MQSVSRRHMIKGAAAAAAAATWNFQVVPSRVFGANDRIRLGAIGTGGKGASDIKGSADAGFEIGALCDVVDVAQYPNVEGRLKNLIGTRRDHPNAPFYMDWREMLEKEKENIDAVTVSTPDHMHAFATIAAMRMGKACYTQKPLTHGIWEARAVSKVAAETGVVTQMGNQAHAEDHMRRIVELVRAGLIGKVKEVHVWTNRPIWPQAIPKYPEGEPVPKYIDWDLWTGPAPMHDYSSKILPFNWRGYWDYGTGALGDMACHIMDMSYWALELGAPVSVEAVSADGKGALTDVSPPTWATITYTFKKGDDEIKYVWYDGYKDAIFNTEQWALESKDYPGNKPRTRNLPPQEVLEGQPDDEGKGYGTVMVGTEGKLWFQRHNENWFVKPSKKLDGLDVPITLSRARGENPHNEFFDAVKAGDPKGALSNFHHSGPFTEMVLLGNLAVRLNKKVEWDSATLSSPNTPEAAKLVKRDYRDGWKLDVQV
ncbi:MAG: Gfo/Idh/MocA family oxidoreductase [Verrucomicrobiae bacterium]|nr:Gfo/Idh/MocA family oxidoreductase [Verrucomicrobiae bacterium]